MTNSSDRLADLVSRFSAALLDKLCAAETKYGHDDGWMRDDWRDSLCHQLVEHVAKGDPRDVAAYAAFAWHHGWSVSAALGANIALAAAEARAAALAEELRTARADSATWQRAAWSYRNGDPHHFEMLWKAMLDPARPLQPKSKP